MKALTRRDVIAISASMLAAIASAIACYEMGLLRNPGAGVVMIPNVPLPSNRDFLLGVTIVIIAAISPLALDIWLRLRWERKIVTAAPKVLDDLASLVKSGLPFMEAFFSIARRDYGPLSKILCRIASRVAAGADFSQAVEDSCKNLPLEAKRYFYLLVEAYMSGGRIGDVLSDAAEHIRALRRFEETRERALKAYMAILVASMVVLYTVSLAVVFFAMKSASLVEQARIVGAGVMPQVKLDVEKVIAALYYTAMTITVCASLVVSKIIKGRAAAGITLLLPLMVLGSLVVLFSSEIVGFIARLI